MPVCLRFCAVCLIFEKKTKNFASAHFFFASLRRRGHFFICIVSTKKHDKDFENEKGQTIAHVR